jgi:lipoate-protein ligase B
VPGARFERDPAGVWLGDAKLAACGLHLARGVAIHGWAWNVATPPSAWDMIVPCGLRTPVVSLAEACRGARRPAAAARRRAGRASAARLGPRVAAALV